MKVKTITLALAILLGGCSKEVADWTPPGTSRHSKELAAAFAKRFEEVGKEYEARTTHKDKKGGPKFVNRLFLETSPYLLQHAHNPVNWYPWGEEAFARARKLNRPVLVSIGYSTCHWCHVMEEESFEDVEIAKYLNENYVCIKVDREERPDIDSIHMAAVQLLNKGRGGWPLNVWLTPDGEPFFGGTYFPARDGDRGRSTGFLTIIKDLRKQVADDPAQVKTKAQALAEQIRARDQESAGGDVPKAAVMLDLAGRYKQNFDSAFGGLRTRGNKFPSSLPLGLLLRAHQLSPDPLLLDMVELTLERMAQGGLRDHIGGGFHRYSTDPRWLVPHFEKMLYDNALLVVAYLEGYQATGRADLAALAEETLEYVLLEMTSPEGGFYSATDADSLTPAGHREEGYFFTWTPDELKEILSPADAALAMAYYDIAPGGNFEGRGIPNTPRPLGSVVGPLGLTVPHAMERIAEIRRVLYKKRGERPAPLRDDKVLSSWNGLMISAFARAVRVLRHRPERAAAYEKAAVRAATFLLGNMRVDGRLRRTYKDGRARLAAYLEDYAFVIQGLLDVYEATHNVKWLKEAQALDETLKKHYEDKTRGGYFRTADDHEKLLMRERPVTDGAIPSGNSIQALNLVRLHALTTDDEYRRRADALFQGFGQLLTKRPYQLDRLWTALAQRQSVTKEVVIVYSTKEARVAPFLDVLARRFVPHHVLAVVRQADTDSVAAVVPLVRHKVASGDKAMAYVCVEQHCELPTTDPSVFEKQLAE